MKIINRNEMKKSLPLCCIKQNICPDLKQFNLLIEKVSSGNKSVHLFIVNINFI